MSQAPGQALGMYQRVRHRPDVRGHTAELENLRRKSMITIKISAVVGNFRKLWEHKERAPDSVGWAEEGRENFPGRVTC